MRTKNRLSGYDHYGISGLVLMALAGTITAVIGFGILVLILEVV